MDDHRNYSDHEHRKKIHKFFFIFSKNKNKTLYLSLLVQVAFFYYYLHLFKQCLFVLLYTFML